MGDVEGTEPVPAGGEAPRATRAPGQPRPGAAELPPFPPARRPFSLGTRGPDGYYGSGS
jgi:hypothetical protein